MLCWSQVKGHIKEKENKKIHFVCDEGFWTVRPEKEHREINYYWIADNL